MIKLHLGCKMGVGVQEVVEMYTTTLEADTILKKDVEESTGVRCDLKRRLSDMNPSSPPTRPPTHTPTSLLQTDPHTDPSPDSTPTKRPRFDSPPSPTSPQTDLDSEEKSRESYESRRKRFLRTAEALRQSGLLDITMKTAELLRKNQELQREIENLQCETKNFVLSVLSNPENRHVLNNIRTGAQLYEVVVPGSQGIMSVSTQRANGTTSDPCSTSTPAATPDTLLGHPSSSPPSPAPSPPSPTSSNSPSSSTSDDTSSLSDDNDSSEEENLAPPKPFKSSTTTAKTKQ